MIKYWLSIAAALLICVVMFNAPAQAQTYVQCTNGRIVITAVNFCPRGFWRA
jgi:hypothetical protein